jgi:hypothetical protein
MSKKGRRNQWSDDIVKAMRQMVFKNRMAFFNDRKAGFLEKLLDLFAREIGAVKTFGFVPLYGIAMHQTGYDHKSTAYA